MVSGLMLGLTIGLCSVLVGGISAQEIPTTILPNDGIHMSARNAALVGLIVAPVSALVVGLVGGVRDGLTIGLSIGVAGGLIAGGEACLRHFLLRLWLIHRLASRLRDHRPGRYDVDEHSPDPFAVAFSVNHQD
jgi:MFS family permease